MKRKLIGGMLLALFLITAACGRDRVALEDGRSRMYARPMAAVQAEPVAGEAAPEGKKPDFNTESYDYIAENPFLQVARNPLSTFSIDVDTASYANVRRFLKRGELPPPDAVRIEEMINYFDYDYPSPTEDYPFSINTLVAGCPWQPRHRLVRIGLKGKEIDRGERPSANLVFLLDVSGSMDEPDKLPLLKRAMKLLVQELTPQDRVAAAIYAGGSGLALPSTPCLKENKVFILSALDKLEPGGATHGSEGIKLAYDVAQKHLIPGGINRVILATDGDFNVGVTNEGDLVRLIQEKAESGIFLTVLGFGTGNLKDSTMEKLADKGNGNYGYIDSITEARKLLVDEMGATLVTIAKDVKIQVEFNPAQVAAYRLIGYENRLLRDEDFNDDTKDAGEIGAGHTVTALYEIVPTGVEYKGPGVDDLKYQQPRTTTEAADSGELLTVKLRYKKPDADVSKRLIMAVNDIGLQFDQAGKDFKFAAAAAAFGMLLRDSAFKGNATYDDVIQMARAGRGEDEHGYRAEFINLVENAAAMSE